MQDIQVVAINNKTCKCNFVTVKALNQARLEANVRAYGDEKQGKKWPSPYAVASGLLLLLSFLKYVYRPLEYLAIGAVVAGAFPIILKAIASFRNLRLDINILLIIAGDCFFLHFAFYWFYSHLYYLKKKNKYSMFM